VPRRKTLITAVFGAIFIIVLLLAGFIRQQYVIPILMYHLVNSNASPDDKLTVSVDIFERQMRFLKDHRYNVVSLEEAASLIRDKKKVPPKTIALTFDDGYKDNYTHAFPILKKYNLPATIFVIINEMDRPQNDRLSWDEIKTMRDSGIITFGSHTLTHPYLIKVDSEPELRRQIFDSKKILEEKLGIPVNAFSYPAGGFNSHVRQLVVEAGYKLAVASNPGKKFSNKDIFVLKRLRISSNAGNLLVFWIETSGYYNFIRELKHK